MKPVFIVCAIALFAAWHLATSPKISQDTEDQFQEFVATYRKSYASKDEFGFRLGVFNDNVNEISRLSVLNPTAKFGINQFADQTPEERKSMLGWKAPKGEKRYRNTPQVVTKQVVDHSSLLTKVKDQASCGSCWAFSAVEQLESGYALANNIAPIAFSAQQFVDCVKGPEFGSEGCNGGWMDDVFDYVLNQNICTEQEYAYTARDGDCQDSKCKTNIHVTGRFNIPEGNVQALLEALETTPVAIAIDASPMSFYRSGVLHIKTENLNHGVQAVGYNLEDSDPYITVRNSWGPRWGLDGFVKVSVNDNGGSALAASYPEFGSKIQFPGLTACKQGEKPDAAKNCLCTYGEKCDKTKPHGKTKDGCDDECGCGEFGFCR
jgi:hypothetical protein